MLESCDKCSNSSFLPLTTVNRYFLDSLIPDVYLGLGVHKKVKQNLEVHVVVHLKDCLNLVVVVRRTT